MTSDFQAITIKDIHAYVDGHLSEEKRRLVEQQMREDASLWETIEHYQQQNALFHQAYDSVLDEPIPDTISISKTEPNKQASLWKSIAASISLLIGGGSVGWFAHGLQTVQQSMINNLAQPAVIAHAVYSPEVRHPVEVAADQQQHLVKWLSKRIGKTINTPDLSTSGFNLVGGRLLPSNNGPAAQFMYEDDKGERLTLYVRNKKRSEENTAFRFYKQNGTNTFYWIDGSLGYVLSGAVNREQLLITANSVYQQLSF